MPISVVWDAETDRAFQSMRGMPREQQMHLMEATVICAIELNSAASVVPGNWDAAFASAKTHHWWRDVVDGSGGPFDGLLTLFDNAEVIVAYNGLNFDFPVLRKYYGNGKTARRRYLDHRLKVLDPMLKIANCADVRYPKLDALLQSNGLSAKTGDGLEAIKMWEQGRRQELQEYCAHDVKQLAQLVHLDRLQVPNVGLLPNCVHGIASAILMQRALQADPLELQDEVETGAPAPPNKR